LSDFTLTEKQIQYFVKDVQRWCRFFSIADYQVKVSEDDSEDVQGSCWANVSNRVAVISINPEWDYEPTNKDISRVAFHEVCELLLMEFGTLAETRFVEQQSLEIARHRVIRTLENVIWRNKKS